MDSDDDMEMPMPKELRKMRTPTIFESRSFSLEREKGSDTSESRAPDTD
jgi:hypothetical protein